MKDIGKMLVFETDNVWKIGGVLLQTNSLEQHSCFIFAQLKCHHFKAGEVLLKHKSDSNVFFLSSEYLFVFIICW